MKGLYERDRWRGDAHETALRVDVLDLSFAEDEVAIAIRRFENLGRGDNEKDL